MSNIAHHDSVVDGFGRAVFVIYFLIVGFALSFIAATIVVLAGMLLSSFAGGYYSAFGDKTVYAVIVMPTFGIVWSIFNMIAGRLFIRRASELGDTRQFQAAAIMLLPSCIIWGFAFSIMVLTSLQLAAQRDTAGLPFVTELFTALMAVGALCNMLAQVYEVKTIESERFKDIVEFSLPPELRSKKRKLERILAALPKVQTAGEFDRNAEKALELYGISNWRLRNSHRPAREVLTAVLKRNERLDEAQAIARMQFD